MMKAGTLS